MSPRIVFLSFAALSLGWAAEGLAQDAPPAATGAVAAWPFADHCPEIADAPRAPPPLAERCRSQTASASTAGGRFADPGIPAATYDPAAADDDGLANACEAREAALDGDREAMRGLAAILRAGFGVPRDMCAAARWSWRAAQLGDRRSMTLLAAHFELGLGAPTDPEQSLKWYGEAAALGSNKAKARLGLLLLGANAATLGGAPPEAAETERGLALLRDASAAGEPTALMAMADIHLEGLGVEPDFATALEWSRRAAATGHPPAMAHYATLQIWSGLFTRKKGLGNCADGLRWAERAAEAGVAAAHALIGDAHRLGCAKGGWSVAVLRYRKALAGGAPMTAALRAALDRPRPTPPEAQADAQGEAEAADQTLAQAPAQASAQAQPQGPQDRHRDKSNRLERAPLEPASGKRPSVVLKPRPKSLQREKPQRAASPDATADAPMQAAPPKPETAERKGGAASSPGESVAEAPSTDAPSAEGPATDAPPEENAASRKAAVAAMAVAIARTAPRRLSSTPPGIGPSPAESSYEALDLR